MTTRGTIIGAKTWRIWLIFAGLFNAVMAVINTIDFNPVVFVSLFATVLMGFLLVKHNDTIHRLVAQRDQEELRIWRREHSPDYEAIDKLDLELNGRTFYHSKGPDYLPEEEFLASQAAEREARRSPAAPHRSSEARSGSHAPIGRSYREEFSLAEAESVERARTSRETAALSQLLRENPPKCGCTNYGPDQVLLCDKHAGHTRQLADKAMLWGISKPAAIKSAQEKTIRELLAENQRKLTRLAAMLKERDCGCKPQLGQPTELCAVHSAQVADLTGQQEAWDRLMADQHPQKFKAQQEDRLSPEQLLVWDQLVALRERRLSGNLLNPAEKCLPLARSRHQSIGQILEALGDQVLSGKNRKPQPFEVAILSRPTSEEMSTLLSAPEH